MQVLNDFNTTVHKALEEIDKHYMKYNGLIVCGTHNPQNTEEIIKEIQKAREGGVPYLGICFGHQLALIEYCRNVLMIKDATSEEFGTGTFVVKKLERLNVGLRDGETYWNNYGLDPEYEKQWIKPDNFITCQYHPEYQSSYDNPHPLLVKFLKLCKSFSAE